MPKILEKNKDQNESFLLDISLQLFDSLYCEFKEQFLNGKILLGGSLYYHILNMNIYRSPSDIDLIVEHSNRKLQREVALFFDKVGDGINYVNNVK